MIGLVTCAAVGLGSTCRETPHPPTEAETCGYSGLRNVYTRY